MAGAGSELLAVRVLIGRLALRLLGVNLLLCLGAMFIGGRVPTTQYIVHGFPYELVLVDGGRGMFVNLTNTPGDVAAEVEPAWSHDGQRLAYTRSESPSARRAVKDSSSVICIFDLAGATTCLPRLSYWDRLARWSPDDAQIAFLTVDARLALAPADGSAVGRVVLDDFYILDYGWLPNGTSIDFVGTLHGEYLSNRYTLDLTTGSVTQIAANVRELITPEERFDRYELRP